jgi:hypothetical protein
MSDALGREQHVDPAARAEVEDGLALVELRDRRRIAAAERGKRRSVRQLLAVAERVEGSAEHVATAVEGLARGAAAGAEVGPRDLRRSSRVALAHLLADITGRGIVQGRAVIQGRGGGSSGITPAAVGVAVAAAVGLGARLTAARLRLGRAAGGGGGLGGAQLSHADSSLTASGIT